MRNRHDLHGYQVNAVNYIRNVRRCALFFDMGLGKTVTALTAVSDALDDLLITRVLVISPLRVANTVWKTEASKWSHLSHLRISVCTGNVSKRNAAVTARADIYVINRENVAWLTKNHVWKWDAIVIDESSSFKSHKAVRFVALKNNLKYTRMAVLLTGTPVPNGYIDLWPQLYIIDGGRRLGRNITSYRRNYFTSDYYGQNYVIIPGQSEVIEKRIKDVCLRLSADDYIQLPDRIDAFPTVEMTPEIERQYKEFTKTLVLNYSEVADDGNEILAPSKAVLLNKLLQFCNGAVYDEDQNWHEIHRLKLDALVEIIDDHPSENFMISYLFKHDAQRILEALKHVNPRMLDPDGRTVDEWNAGKIRVLIAHPQSAGHGLNMQYGGSNLVWFGIPWSLELYQQMNARLYRQGQAMPVRITHLLLNSPVEKLVHNALRRKDYSQNRLFDAITELFEEFAS